MNACQPTMPVCVRPSKQEGMQPFLSSPFFPTEVECSRSPCPSLLPSWSTPSIGLGLVLSRIAEGHEKEGEGSPQPSPDPLAAVVMNRVGGGEGGGGPHRS